MHRIHHIALAATMSVLTITCSQKDAPAPLARVYDKYLYPSDLDPKLLANISHSDSIILIKAYIDKWVQNQLLLNLAETNLSDEDKNVERELDNYRTSLLIFKYEQAYIAQKLDTTFSEDDALKYYKDHQEAFALDHNIVKALYVKLRKEAQQMKRIRELYRSNLEEDLQTLDNLAYQAATKYDFFGDRWVNLDLILQQLPHTDNPSTYMSQVRRNGYIDVEDDEFIYLVHFKEVMTKGETMPYEYTANQIRIIMLNARRSNTIRTLERDVVMRGHDKGAVEIYFGQTNNPINTGKTL